MFTSVWLQFFETCNVRVITILMSIQLAQYHQPGIAGRTLVIIIVLAQENPK
jgi:hypothetical protein